MLCIFDGILGSGLGLQHLPDTQLPFWLRSFVMECWNLLCVQPAEEKGLAPALV